MNFSYFKALHIIFIITWFSGLFYMVRLFIYHKEALEKADPDKTILTDQFKIMEKRLWYGITWPSAILTLIFGLGQLHQFFPLTDHPWLISKLVIVFLLYGYHDSIGRIFKKLKKNECQYSSNWLRMYNEVATLFLFSIVMLAVLKDSLDAIKLFALLVFLSLVLFIAIKAYRKARANN